MKKEISVKAELAIFSSMFVAILSYGGQSRVMTKRMQSQIPATEMKFRCWVFGITLLNRVYTLEIRDALLFSRVATFSKFRDLSSNTIGMGYVYRRKK